jgi:carboxyl-terminal processing protease
VVSEKSGAGDEVIYRSRGYKLLEQTPTVILVNEGSASASEIVAGALRDVRGSKLIGQKTFGKGSVQQLDALPLGASLKITIAKWFTPKGTSINDTGLEPDIKVEPAKEGEGDPNKDPVIEKAVEVLKGM